MLQENFIRKKYLETTFLLVKKNWKIIFLVSISLIVFASIWMRFYQLGELNVGMSNQEAYLATNSLENSDEKNLETFSKQKFGLLHNITLLSFQLFDINIFALRFISALIGSLTIIGFIFLLKKLNFSKILILLGTFLFSFSYWHINLSRTLNHEIILIFLTTWTFSFLLTGLSNKKVWPFIVSGILLGVGTYISTLSLTLLVPVLLFISLNTLLDKTLFKKIWLHISLLLVIILLFIAPLIFLQIKLDSYSILNSIKELSGFKGLNLINSNNFITNLGSISYIGDSNQALNHHSLPMIPFTWSILFLFGATIAIRNFINLSKKNKLKLPKNIQANIFSLSLLLFALSLASLNSELENNSRTLAISMPAIFVLCLTPFEYLAQIYQKMKLSTRISLKKWRWHMLQASLLGIILATIITGLSQMHLYFGIWSKDPETQKAFHQKEFEFGRMLKSLERESNNFLVLPRTFFVEDSEESFALSTIKFAGFPDTQHFNLLTQEEILSHAHCKDSFIVFYETNNLIKKQLQKKCPMSKFRKISSYTGDEVFWTMKE